MVRVLRRMLIAFGCFVAAYLCVGFLGGIAMVGLGIQASSGSSLVAAAAAVVLGWLIYRDILRRERPRA